jgi:hypothetical protein
MVIQDDIVLRFYRSCEGALRADVNAFDLRRDFLVKQVLAPEPVNFVFSDASF